MKQIKGYGYICKKRINPPPSRSSKGKLVDISGPRIICLTPSSAIGGQSGRLAMNARSLPPGGDMSDPLAQLFGVLGAVTLLIAPRTSCLINLTRYGVASAPAAAGSIRAGTSSCCSGAGRGFTGRHVVRLVRARVRGVQLRTVAAALLYFRRTHISFRLPLASLITASLIFVPFAIMIVICRSAANLAGIT